LHIQGVDGRKEIEHYLVKLPAFEGPFDLLYYLINKEEINIWDIPLARITDQYLHYLQKMRQLEVELAGEFLVMAASLLYLKSRLMLPNRPAQLCEREEEELYFGSKEELVRSLLEYKLYKSIAASLKERETGQQKIYLRSARQQRVVIVNRQRMLYPHALDSLKQSLKRLYEKTDRENTVMIVSFPEKTTFRQKLDRIVRALRRFTASSCYLEDFLEKKEKSELVVTFFVLLELARRGRLCLHQEKIFGRIRVILFSGGKAGSDAGEQ